MLQDGREHSPEAIWQAQELYCVDRLSFAKVAEIVGVASSTLKRWSKKYNWQEKRFEIAKAESDIRADKVLARSRVIKALLAAPRADMAFAVSSLESLTLKEVEAARQAKERRAEKEAEKSVIKLNVGNEAQAINVLKQAIERKLSLLLSRPEDVNLKAVQEVQKCLSLLADMQATLPDDGLEKFSPKGLSRAMHDQFMAVLSGELEV